MDLHVYRNSQDRWHDLRSAAREHGAMLAVNAVTLDELVERLTPDLKTASAGQRWFLAENGVGGNDHPGPPARGLSGHPSFSRRGISPPEAGGVAAAGRRGGHSGGTLFPVARYAHDAIAELKASRVKASELRAAGQEILAEILDHYDRGLREAGLLDPQDRCVLAASRVIEKPVPWLQRFERIVLHALYDLTEAEFILIRSLIEAMPDGGTVMLFNTTANVKPTQFAEWTWQRFIQDESLAEKTFPEFCRSANPNRAVLERLFTFDDRAPLLPDDSLRILEASGRYREVEAIGSDIADLIASGESPNEIAIVVRHIEAYGEMLEDVFSRYGIPHSFETGVPLVRVPFIKYWLSLLDLADSERSRDAMARVMSSAYFSPRLSPEIDVERTLAGFGYIDRNHLRASALAARKNSPLATELERIEQSLDELEKSSDTVRGFLTRLQPAAVLTARDRQAWRSLVDELEAIDRIAGTVPFAEFRKIASEVSGIGTIARLSGAEVAPGVPRVRIIAPRSLGYRDYRWIFAPGIADGEFPARVFTNPLLPDETIEAINLRIRPRRLMSARDRNRREPLYLFMILDSATRRVTLTYPGNTLEGERIYPSVYIGEIARHYAESPVRRVQEPSKARDRGEWLRRMANEWRIGSLHDDRAAALLGEDIVSRANLERTGIARADLSRGAMPVDGLWHPSELNTLAACPFVFLARHRLRFRAAEIPDFEVPPSEVGILAHHILRDFYNRPLPASLDDALERMNEIITRRLAATDVNGQGPYSVFDPSLWKIRRRQLIAVLHEYVKFAVRDALDGFETQPEYLDAPLPAARLGDIQLAGKPDHVAVHRTDGRIDAIRIDDFKYSAASSATNKQLKESFQIPVYAYLAIHALNAMPDHPRIEGRYLLLRSPSNPVVSHPIDDAVFDDVRARIGELVFKVREGKLHPDPMDKQDCGDCDYRRLCRLYGA